MDADDQLEILPSLGDRAFGFGPPGLGGPSPWDCCRDLDVFFRLFSAPTYRIYDEIRALPENPTDAEMFEALVRAGNHARPAEEPRRRFGRHVRAKIIRIFQQTCLYCQAIGTRQKGPDGQTWHLDHFVPLARGGDDMPHNLVLAC